MARTPLRDLFNEDQITLKKLQAAIFVTPL
jgi:hypothetical protein